MYECEGMPVYMKVSATQPCRVPENITAPLDDLCGSSPDFPDRAKPQVAPSSVSSRQNLAEHYVGPAAQ